MEGPQDRELYTKTNRYPARPHRYQLLPSDPSDC